MVDPHNWQFPAFNITIIVTFLAAMMSCDISSSSSSSVQPDSLRFIANIAREVLPLSLALSQVLFPFFPAKTDPLPRYPSPFSLYLVKLVSLLQHYQSHTLCELSCDVCSSAGENISASFFLRGGSFLMWKVR